MASTSSCPPEEVSPSPDTTAPRSSEESTPLSYDNPEQGPQGEDTEVNVPTLRKNRAIPKAVRFKKHDKQCEWNLSFNSRYSDPIDKRTNRRNKNKCDTCGQGGLIFCCDSCPLVFHEECHQPRIDVTDKNAKFYCRNCKVIKPIIQDLEGYEYKIRDKKQDEFLPSLFHNLCIKMLTVKEQPFTLPKMVTEQVVKLPRVWVGDDLHKSKKRRHDQDSDCYVCKKPVYFPDYNKCYFCPLVVHLDCQMEPQTARRVYAWRCPCHIENFVDSTMVDSESYVKRAKLYQKYATIDPNLDGDEVMMDCARKLANDKINSQRQSSDELMEAALALADLKNTLSGNNTTGNAQE